MQCQSCNQPLKLIPAGVSRKTGKSYNSFYACINKCQQPFSQSPQTTGSPTTRENEQTGFQVLTEHIVALEAKVDSLVDLLKQNLTGE